MKKVSKEYQNVKLTPVQEQAVRDAIVTRMIMALKDSGHNLEVVQVIASEIAREIVEDTQQTLIQLAVFKNAVNKAINNSKPLKKAKKVAKKVTLPKKFGKMKKNARK